MSTEQSENQSSQDRQAPPSPAAFASTPEGAPAQNGQGQQQRRRRRRRKAGKGGGGGAPQGAEAVAGGGSGTNGSFAEPEQGGPQQGMEARFEQVRDKAPEQVWDQDQNRKGGGGGQRPQYAAGGGAAQEPVRDQPVRQALSQRQRKQQRQGKGGGGSNNGLNGGSGGGAGGGSNQGRQHYQKAAPQPQPSNRENMRESNPGNGTGQPGGMRRKNKVRRAAPSFVGPMDHSYRVANGNIADGPPSTMDFRRDVNGNGNGNVYGRSGYSDFADIAVPAVLREDAPVRIICFIEDLFIVAKMQETARKLGVKVAFVKAEKDTVAKLTETPEAERPSLIVFDLNNVNAKPLTLIPKLKAKLKRGTSVIGFLSHIQGDLKVKAIEAGCDMVMPKSAFSQNLPNLLRRHGLDEELEEVEA